MRAGPVPVVTMDADARRLIDYTADPEIFLTIALIGKRHEHVLAVANTVVASDIGEGLLQRNWQICGLRGEYTAGTECHRRVFMDLFDRSKIVGSIEDYRPAERQPELLARV